MRRNLPLQFSKFYSGVCKAGRRRCCAAMQIHTKQY